MLRSKPGRTAGMALLAFTFMTSASAGLASDRVFLACGVSDGRIEEPSWPAAEVSLRERRASTLYLVLDGRENPSIRYHWSHWTGEPNWFPHRCFTSPTEHRCRYSNSSNNWLTINLNRVEGTFEYREHQDTPGGDRRWVTSTGSCTILQADPWQAPTTRF